MIKYKPGTLLQMIDYEFEGRKEDDEYMFTSDCLIYIYAINIVNASDGKGSDGKGHYFYYKTCTYIISKSRWEDNGDYSSSYFDDGFKPIDDSLDPHYHHAIKTLFDTNWVEE